MPDDLESLTDKEKEALRLLLAGHDAKSSAGELDISVHAVNDRLRNARRKLNVSSSREAARILGDAEGAHPQNAAHTSFGMERTPTPNDNAILNEIRRTGPSRAVWLTGGMLTMSIAIAAAAIFLFAGTGNTPDPAATNAGTDSGANTGANTGVSQSSPQASTKADPQALSRARDFMGKVDAGEWRASWDAAGELFRTEVTAAQWAAQVEPVREPLGRVIERRLANEQQVTNMPGGPQGEFRILQFHTRFEGKPGNSIETVVMMRGDEGWEVTGYFIA